VYKDYYPPVMGGIENTINRLARGTGEEFDVSVLVCAGRSRPGEQIVDGVRVVRVGELGRLLSAPFSPGFPAALAREAAHADLLHFHHPNPTGDVAYLLSRPKAPVVMTYHSDVVRQRFAMFAFGPVQERMMRACRAIMPTSPDYIDSSEWLSRHRATCHVVPLGIDLEHFVRTPAVEQQAAQVRSRHATPLIIFVGRLRHYKGLHFLVEAMKEVQATLLLVGTGPEEARLRADAVRHGVSRRCVFLGELTDAEVVAHLYAADTFCLPSHLRSEAFGICQIEAMACGLPIVNTRLATGVPFVSRDGLTGLSVEPGSPAALAAALNRLLFDDALRRKMGEAGLNRTRELFSAEAMCLEVKKVYRSVLAG
jgi:rhamnosyl/mannosyltransferase